MKTFALIVCLMAVASMLVAASMTPDGTYGVSCYERAISNDCIVYNTQTGEQLSSFEPQ